MTLSERAPESPELRLLTVPGLYFEALWLHYKNDKDDTFIPILSPDFAVNKPIGRAELLEALRALAQKRLEAEPSEP